jgi:uncharacterized protein (DUF2236 family)
MTVTRAELEQLIAAVRAEVTDPTAGIYGPRSISWEIGKEAALFVGGGRAALLQLAHPFVAHAVDQHSATRTDPLGRFQRTFDAVFAIVFGELEHAFRSARRVHAIHSRISGRIEEDVGRFVRGAQYHASDEQALLWVHATLIDTAVLVYDAVVRPLPSAEKDRYYQESKRFAYLFGIGDRVLPRDWSAFRDYFDRTLDSDTIAVGVPAREMAGFLFATPKPAMRPVFRWLSLMTAGFMPKKLRVPFGLEHGAVDEALFRSSLRLLRATYPRLPRRLRYVPAYVEARRRLAGRAGSDRIGRWLERLALRGIDAGSA